jgi:hypothetical protein
MEMWIGVATKIFFLVLSTIVTLYVVPWLKEKRVYDTVKKMVDAAEKWAENNNINKKEWVIEKLEASGIDVNEYVEALIEAAVQELDIALGKKKE